MPEVHRFRTEAAPARRLREVRALLDQAFEDGFSQDDWEHSLGGWHFIVSDGDVVLSHAALVSRTLVVAGRPVRTGYVEAVATAPDRQGAGLGSRVLGDLATVVRNEFELGALATSRPSFYERLGWDRWRGPTFVRDGAETIRTEAEDDGVMVLRFGPSASIDLTAPISCERRRGDDW